MCLSPLEDRRSRRVTRRFYRSVTDEPELRLKSAKNKFYENIYKDSVADSVVNKLALIIGEKQMAVDLHMLQHFKNLRGLCTLQQLPKFDSLFKHVVEKITVGRLKRHNNR